MKEKILVKQQDPKTRISSFIEVSRGYNEQEALNEASRCLSCSTKPCMQGCPLHNDIPSFISLIKDKKYQEAFEVISKTSSLPSICSRVCPHEKQCEGHCTLAKANKGISIGALEAFVCDHTKEEISPSKSNKKVAIIGSGPSAIACAKTLLKEGIQITIFEEKEVLGGILKYGIPSFRLNKEIINKEFKLIKSLGAEIKTCTKLGKDIILEKLKSKFDYIFVSVGSPVASSMNIEGLDANGVITANDFLYQVYAENKIEPVFKNKIVGIVGGGNVAIDSARTALRLGAKEVHIIYRRSMVELPANKQEVEEAIEEGIIFNLLINPVKIIKDDSNNIKGIQCIKMELGEPDEKGRRRPVEVPESEFEIVIDQFIMAIGSAQDSSVYSLVKTDKWNCIEVDENCQSSDPQILAGGDCVTGPLTVANAVKMGQIAAKTIISK